MTTMREKLIEAIEREGYPDPLDSDDVKSTWAADLLDAILTTLREPDDGLLGAGADEALAIVQEQDPGEPDLTPAEREYAKDHSRRIFTAMIDHLRAGK